jgi:hypothetical protein
MESVITGVPKQPVVTRPAIESIVALTALQDLPLIAPLEMLAGWEGLDGDLALWRLSDGCCRGRLGCSSDGDWAEEKNQPETEDSSGDVVPGHIEPLLVQIADPCPEPPTA